VSKVFGFDRGTPIDRILIEHFLIANKSKIHGTVVELGEATYTKKFGGKRVNKSIVINYEAKKKGEISVNLETGEGIVEGIADCFICTQTYSFIYDFDSAIKNSLKMLKKNGHLLFTVPGVTQISNYDMDKWGQYWSFTTLSMRRCFEKFAPPRNIRIESFGNVKLATSFLYGIAAEELSDIELNYNDENYQFLIVGVIKK